MVEESISEIDSIAILRPICDRVLKRGPGNLNSHARW